jgi:hypothetical protein
VTPEKLDGARKDLELQFLGMLHDEASFAIISPDDRTRADWHLAGNRPGTRLGEAIRFFLQFKTFSLAFGQKGIRGNRLAGGGGRNWGALASLIGTCWILGYGVMTLKDVLKNKTRRELFDENWHPNYKTFVAALLQGGGLGLYSDFLFSKSDRFGANWLADMMGPAASAAYSLGSIVQDITGAPGAELDKTVKKTKSDLFWFGLNNTPYINMFYTRAALDFAILNWAQEKLTPGTFKRREKAMTKDYGQKFILPPLDYSIPGRP